MQEVTFQGSQQVSYLYFEAISQLSVSSKSVISQLSVKLTCDAHCKGIMTDLNKMNSNSNTTLMLFHCKHSFNISTV